MFLAIDIGNTNIKAGLFNGDSLENFFISPDIEKIIHSLLQKEIDSAAFTSVSTGKEEKFLRYFEKNFSIIPYHITHKSIFNLQIEYSTPETIGIDRVCSAEGAFSLFKKDKDNPGENDFIISVDFGTATTINIVNSAGSFIGGLILPGIHMMFESLNKNTAQLPLVTENDYISLVGTSTNSSIAAGVINSIVGLLEHVEHDLQINRKAKKVNFYITGGNAEMMKKHLTVNSNYVRELVLIGAKEIYKNNLSSK